MQGKKSLTKYKDLSKHNHPSCGNAFVSNELDILIKSFIQVFKNALDRGHLRHLVVIPTNVIKNRLIQQISDEMGICFGIRFLSLPQAIEHIMKLSRGTSLRFPHHHHLMAFLDFTIKSLITNSPELFPDLTRYAKDDEKKRLSLAEHLSHTFLSYGLYGGEALGIWQNKKGWQQHLFALANNHWDFPHTFFQEMKEISINSYIHLFALPVIPSIYQNIFDKVSANIYHKSATPHFVSDILTDKALASIDQKLKKAQINPSERSYFHSLGKEPNRLFANFAGAGNTLSDWISEKQVEEHFVFPEGECALNEHQRAIFELEPIPEMEFENDTSIQVHSCPTKFREIETIYETLLDLFTSDPSLKTSEIQIFAPDIEHYAPAIEFVFDQKNSPFGYIISDICDNSRLNTLSMIRSFFSLANGRFKPKEIFELLSSPCTKNPPNCSDEEIKAFWILFEKIHVHWGFDKEMRSEILGVENITGQGTFRDAFNKLLLSLSYLSSPIEISSSEAFGDLIFFLKRIACDLQSLKKKKRTISQWIETIFQLMEDYFEDSETKEGFLKEIIKLTPLTQIIKSPTLDEILSFDLILKIIEEITSAKEGKIVNTKRPPISFSSIGEGLIASPKVTILLGMDEEAFPRTQTKRSIDELINSPGSEHRLSITEKDKMFFFEAIAHTRDHLIISYTHISASDGKELFPSLLVEDLLNVTKNISIKSHPPTSPNMHLPPPVESATLHTNQTEPHPSFDSIEISDLTRLATHPLRFFLQKRCGIFLGREDEEESREMREFMLSYQGRAEIRQKAYLNDKNEIIQHIDTHGLMPTAIFSIAAKIEVESEIESANQNLKLFGLSQNDFIHIIFDPAIDSPLKRSKQEFLHPPIQVKETLLYGRMDMVTHLGLFSFSESSIASIWKLWPKLLIASLIDEWKFEKSIIFAKDGQKVSFNIKDPLASLELFLEYHRLAYNTPSPLMPENIKSYAAKKTALQNNFLFKDPYLDAIKPNMDIDWTKFIEEVCESI